jgi:N-methylhydantoinase A
VSARLPGSAAAVPVPVYDRARLLAGNLITGPAIVHQLDATTVVLGGQRARIDELAGMWIEETS